MASSLSIIGTNLFTSGLSNALILLGVLLIAGAIIGVALFIRYQLKFNFIVEIYSVRSDMSGKTESKIYFDKGAILYDKTDKSYYFRIKSYGVDLPAPPYGIVSNASGKNLVKVLQKSADQFQYLYPDQIEEKIVVRADGTKIHTAQLKSTPIESDISWLINRRVRDKQLFNPEGALMRLLPFIVPTLMFVLVIFLTWMVLKNFDVLRDVSNNLLETANVLKGASHAEITTVQ